MMISRSKTGFASLALLCGLGWLVTACPASLDDFCSDGACAPRTTANEGGGPDADSGGDALMPDPCIDNPTALSCLDESTALFVSNANGNDQDPAAGTRKIPFRTINAALAKIDMKRRRIYVCEGAYFEDLSLNTGHSGISIFGGVDCAWNAAPTAKPVIGATANPLKIDGAAALSIADVAVVAKDATTGSSIAAFIVGGSVVLRRVRLAAGKGAPGTDGSTTNFVFPSQAALDGNNAVDNAGVKTGGPAKPVACPGGLMSKGGAGGDPGAPGLSGEPASTGGAGGTLTDCEMNGAGGKKGAAGSTPPSSNGATTAGDLQQGGWLSTPGIGGTVGGPGQGGGGGAGYLGAGGSGGGGGCGGAGGGFGGGGGASIALALYQASATVTESTLDASKGGDGGKGALGQQGQSEFGIGGTRNGSACNGGNGGIGGTGSAGGGGAGGSSIGVVYKGVKPTVDAATQAKITLGGKGSGGQLSGTTAGIDGEEAPIFESK